MIRIKDIVKIYGDKECQTYALKGISLDINDGEFVAIMGPSGSGKSTLLNIIGCMDVLTEGEFIVDETIVSSLTNSKRQEFAKNNISFVFQDFALMNDYTSYENVELPLRIKGVSGRERKKIVLESLDKVGMSEFYKKYPNKLSGGQQQRVAIARALASGNKYILADEPTGALDRENGMEIINVLKDIAKEGRTVIMVTHNEELAKFADRIIYIEDGLINQ
ncbi:MAG: ABC transporter ATP-binding protein [Lachnospiraceae bacterium]|nr:ABC transporter ATP-binding protein [Lachnospiraceae bacterium]